MNQDALYAAFEAWWAGEYDPEGISSPGDRAMALVAWRACQQWAAGVADEIRGGVPDTLHTHGLRALAAYIAAAIREETK